MGSIVQKEIIIYVTKFAFTGVVLLNYSHCSQVQIHVHVWYRNSGAVQVLFGAILLKERIVSFLLLNLWDTLEGKTLSLL